MSFTTVSMEAELRRFGARRFYVLEDKIQPFRFRDFGPLVILALSSRESGMQQINSPNDADKGWLQINSTAHRGWLSGVDGVSAHNWEASGQTDLFAIDPGLMPRWTTSLGFAMRILEEHYNYAGSTLGLKGNAQIRFALAAYNAGRGGALEGHNSGNVDLKTAHGNYSKDVLDRWRTIRDVTRDWGWLP
jgi:hypothetical protein